MGNGDSKEKTGRAAVVEEKVMGGGEAGPVKLAGVEEVAGGPVKAGEKFEVILSPALRERGPLSPRQEKGGGGDGAAIQAKLDAAAERRRLFVEKTVEKAERMEKGSATPVPHPNPQDKASALQQKLDGAEAKREQHLKEVTEKARALASPKGATPPASPASLPRLRQKLDEAEQRRNALRDQKVHKLHQHEEHAAQVRLNASHNPSPTPEDQ